MVPSGNHLITAPVTRTPIYFPEKILPVWWSRRVRAVPEVLGAGSDRVDQSQGRPRAHTGDLCLIAIKQAPVFGPGHAFHSTPPNTELSFTAGRTQVHREKTRSYPSVEDRHIPVTAVTDHKPTTITRRPVILISPSGCAMAFSSYFRLTSGRFCR